MVWIQTGSEKSDQSGNSGYYYATFEHTRGAKAPHRPFAKHAYEYWYNSYSREVEQRHTKENIKSLPCKRRTRKLENQ